MVYIHQSDYENYQEEFGIYFHESGAYYELDSDREKMEFDFISNQVGSDEWEVIEDLRITTSIEEFWHPNYGRHRGGTVVRNALTTYHNVPPEEAEKIMQDNFCNKSRCYNAKTKRLYIRTRVATLKLTQSQWATACKPQKEK